MEASLMEPEDAKVCRWLGWGLGKGVTHRTTKTSVFAAPSELQQGLHAQMVQDFGEVDPLELIYTDDHVLGFGDWVRWAYLSDPADTNTTSGILGVDWSISCRRTAGVAVSMQDVATIVATLHEQGIPPEAEVVLFDWCMREPPYITTWKSDLNLLSVMDWCKRGIEFFRPMSPFCPRCGLRTFNEPSRFCFRCGFERSNQALEVRDDEAYTVECG